MIILLVAIILALFITVIIPIYVYYLHAQISKEKIIFENSHLPQESSIEYYRDIPLNHDIIRAYGIASYFNIIDNKTNLIGALLLSWLKFGYIEFIKDNLESGYAIRFPKDFSFDNEVEQTLFDILLKACDNNYILEYKEFESYCYINYMDILRWFGTVDYYVDEILKIDGCIKEENVVISKMFNLITRLDHHKIITKKATQRAIELLGFKKYLLTYSNISNKASEEVALWEDYLIFAQLLGIASEIDSDFMGLYENYDAIENIRYISDSIWHYIRVQKIKSSSKLTSHNTK